MLTNLVMVTLQTKPSGTQGPEHLPSCPNLKNTSELQVYEGLWQGGSHNFHEYICTIIHSELW